MDFYARIVVEIVALTLFIATAALYCALASRLL